MFWRLLLSLPALIGQCFRAIFIGAMIGPVAFFLGQLLPRQNFDYDLPPYSAYKWERGGNIYRLIGIHRWKDAVPDMSRYIRSMVKKKIVIFRDPDYLDALIRETCVAELVHYMLMLLSPIFLIFMSGYPGVIAAAAYCLCNMPFVLIQRYNRPRLVELMERQLATKQRTAQESSPAKV